MSRIFKVHFATGEECYFSSLSAIYEVFTPEQIGCKVERLWEVGVSRGETYRNRHCTITREELIRKPQKHPAGKR